jgi:type III pantothenate kinase
LLTRDNLPLEVRVNHPDRVGMDRLLNAVAVNATRAEGEHVIAVDAGSAVTVDWVDGQGAFRGGAIFPGLRLMSQALHHATALLPNVTITEPPARLGVDTEAAMRTGIYHAVVGGIDRLISELYTQADARCRVVLTGGDATLLTSGVRTPHALAPWLTLQGMLAAAPRSHA